MMVYNGTKAEKNGPSRQKENMPMKATTGEVCGGIGERAIVGQETPVGASGGGTRGKVLYRRSISGVGGRESLANPNSEKNPDK